MNMLPGIIPSTGFSKKPRLPPSTLFLLSLFLANMTDYSFGANYDPGRRVLGKIRGGVIGECKKEFESTIFACLETSIKLAKGSVVSPVSEDIEQVQIPFS